MTLGKLSLIKILKFAFTVTLRKFLSRFLHALLKITPTVGKQQYLHFERR